MENKLFRVSTLLIIFACTGSVLAAPIPPKSFAYILQASAFEKSKTTVVSNLAACGRDWLIIDASFTTGQPWMPEDISKIRAGRPARKVIAYLSIGEAEDYRAYWRHEWDADRDGKPDAGAPAFLLAENPAWKGDYRVKYWQRDWQQLILVRVDEIMAAGFDGVYLDIVDGFENFERDGKNFIDDRLNPETKQSYRRDMVEWVKTVGARVRKTNRAALVIPQNGTQLLAHPDFLGTVDAVGVEDLFTNGDKDQPDAEVKYKLDFLSAMTAAHKPVLDVEYPGDPNRRRRIRQEAAEHGFVWLITDRQLKTLGEAGR